MPPPPPIPPPPPSLRPTPPPPGPPPPPLSAPRLPSSRPAGRDAPPPSGPRRPTDLEGESGLYRLLQLNAYDRFDLVALNAINLGEAVRDADRKNRVLAQQLRHVAESLLPRVRQETGERDEVTQLLRDLACHWYLESARSPAVPGDRSWKAWASDAWGGLFYESRVTGGWRKPRLADRLLWASHGRAEPDPALRERLFGRPATHEESETLAGRPHDEVLQLRVAQAILDDLASSPRSPSNTIALAHLDDLAVSVGVRDVNTTLQSLFHSFDDESFLFLDPDRNPEVGLCTLHWPSDRRTPSSTVYQLVIAPTAGGPTVGPGVAPGNAPAPDAGPDLTNWFLAERSTAGWIALLTQLVALHARLPAPPGATCRKQPGFTTLRAALVQGPPANELFGKAQWKGRPTDLTLLNQLLAQGSLLPDVETDGDYLEAELNDLVSGDPRTGGDGGVWSLDNAREVRRTVGSDGVRTYSIRVTPPSSG